MEHNCPREPSKSAEELGRGMSWDGWGLGLGNRSRTPPRGHERERVEARRSFRLPAISVIARPTLAA
jgi:hypothetical protein